MNLQQLRYIVEIEKTKSITWAADNLYMGQPNLSKSVRELEVGLGFDIFTRSAKGMFPTEKGRKVLDHAHKILGHVCEIQRLNVDASPQRQVFRVSVPRGAYFSELCSRFIMTLDLDNPFQFDFQGTDGLQAIENIRVRKHRMAIIRYPKSDEALFSSILQEHTMVTENLAQWQCQVLMSCESPLLEQQTLGMPALEGYVELAHDLYVSLPGERENDDGFQQKVYMDEREEQYAFLRAIPNAYMWSVPIPGRFLERHCLAMRACEMDDESRVMKDVLVYPADSIWVELDKLFIDTLYEHYSQLKESGLAWN